MSILLAVVIAFEADHWPMFWSDILLAAIILWSVAVWRFWKARRLMQKWIYYRILDRIRRTHWKPADGFAGLPVKERFIATLWVPLAWCILIATPLFAIKSMF